MEADWEVEIGGGAPVIETHWSGFIDLRNHPERVSEIAEAAAFPPLAALLLALNGIRSPLWTAKCDLWQPDPNAIAVYIDLLPLEGRLFAEWQQAEALCREWGRRMAGADVPGCSAELVVRLAIAGEAEGFGVTAYLSAEGAGREVALAAGMAVFGDAVLHTETPEAGGSKLQ